MFIEPTGGNKIISLPKALQLAVLMGLLTKENLNTHYLLKKEAILEELEKEIVKTVVEKAVAETLGPAMAVTGEILALPFRAIYTKLLPLRKWVAESEYSYNEFIRVLAKKAEGIPPEKLSSPESYIAIPALQAISYCMDSENLRDMYANLIISSMNIDEKENVHPAFVEVIKQLTPDEARLLKPLKALEVGISLVFMYIPSKYHPDNKVRPYILNEELEELAGCTSIPSIPIYLDNLERLKLIGRDSFIPNKKSSYIIKKAMQYDNDYDVEHGARLTQFGQALCKVCIN